MHYSGILGFRGLGRPEGQPVSIVARTRFARSRSFSVQVSAVVQVTHGIFSQQCSCLGMWVLEARRASYVDTFTLSQAPGSQVSARPLVEQSTIDAFLTGFRSQTNEMDYWVPESQASSCDRISRLLTTNGHQSSNCDLTLAVLCRWRGRSPPTCTGHSSATGRVSWSTANSASTRCGDLPWTRGPSFRSKGLQKRTASQPETLPLLLCSRSTGMAW